MNPNPKPLSPASAAKGRCARTEKKAAAVRENGKLGGRPRSKTPSPNALRMRVARAKKKICGGGHQLIQKAHRRYRNASKEPRREGSKHDAKILPCHVSEYGSICADM